MARSTCSGPRLFFCHLERRGIAPQSKHLDATETFTRAKPRSSQPAKDEIYCSPSPAVAADCRRRRLTSGLSVWNGMSCGFRRESARNRRNSSIPLRCTRDDRTMPDSRCSIHNYSVSVTLSGGRSPQSKGPDFAEHSPLRFAKGFLLIRPSRSLNKLGVTYIL